MSDYGVADIPRTKETEFYGAPWEEEGLKNLLACTASRTTAYPSRKRNRCTRLSASRESLRRWFATQTHTMEWWDQWLKKKPIS